MKFNFLFYMSLKLEKNVVKVTGNIVKNIYIYIWRKYPLFKIIFTSQNYFKLIFLLQKQSRHMSFKTAPRCNKQTRKNDF